MSDLKYRPLMVRLPPDIDDRLRYFAASRERALSWVVRKALGEYLDDDEWDASEFEGSSNPQRLRVFIVQHHSDNLPFIQETDPDPRDPAFDRFRCDGDDCGENYSGWYVKEGPL